MTLLEFLLEVSSSPAMPSIDSSIFPVLANIRTLGPTFGATFPTSCTLDYNILSRYRDIEKIY